ncbi:RAC1 [Mytilus edulis]|uniref:RAC1 n=1 Tax=Mytilus edulis TaxID=6550 RepID=A0A8S3UL22_MYTED|nr:RAC1 [Mytilus edulis]
MTAIKTLRNLYEILYDIHKKGRLIEKIAEMKRIKTVIVGDCCSGKTMLVQAMTQSDFKINLPYVATVSDNIALALHFNGVDTEVGIWDTAGSEEYYQLRSLAYPDTDVVLVTFDIANPVSFENVEKKWLPEIYHAMINVPRILVGTKLGINFVVKRQ